MIEFRDLKKSFGEKSVLSGLTLTVARGEIYGLLGPNGAGKTTAIGILCNLLDADAGSVRVGSGALPGVLPQEHSVYRALTCRQNLRFFASVYGISGARARARVDQLIELFDLGEYADTEVAHLSGGWQRRVNIAASLVHSPDVLVLDEPTAGLDIEARYELWHIIKQQQRAGATILLTTHHLDEAERLCSRVGILHNGHIAIEGTLEQLRRAVPATQLANIESDDEDGIARRAEELGWALRHYGGRLTLLLPHEHTLKAVVDLLHGTGLTSVSLLPVGLEHVYVEVTGAAKV